MTTAAYGRLWVKGDWNGFFGLFVNILTNTIVLTAILLYVIKMPTEIVFGRVLPGIGLSVALGNIYYAFMARRLARKEKRHDVTAMPYGTGVEHIFIVSFLILGPVYWKTGDAVLAWKIGVAWCVILGIIEVSGSVFAHWLKKVTPRAAMLGSVAGLAITFIAMKPAMQSWEIPYIGFISVGLFLVGWIAGKKLPWNIPAGFAMIVIGALIGWLTGYMKPDALVQAAGEMQFYPPRLDIPNMFSGMTEILPYLAAAIPLGFGNVLAALDFTESAEAAGDKYNLREVMIVDGVGTLFGAAFGNVFPSTVYIGHPGWKYVGARAGYALATGIASLIVCVVGLIPVLMAIIPMPAVLPILVYIGFVITAQAFQAVPSSHAPAVVFAILPWIANWGLSLVDGALTAAGTTAAEAGMIDKLNEGGIIYNGLLSLGSGPILSSMLYAALAVFLIDNKMKPAIYCCLIAAVSSYFGLMHAASMDWGAAKYEAIGYLGIALLIFLMYRTELFRHKKAGGHTADFNESGAATENITS